MNDDLATVKSALSAGADPNAKTDDQQSPLHWAARYGRTEIAQFLINSGADINTKNGDQHTPLHLAVNFIESVELLLSKGADPTLLNYDGKTARQLVDNKGHTRISALLATAEAWHTHIKPLLGSDNKLDAGQLVDDKGQPTAAMKNMSDEAFALLAKPSLYREGMEGLAKIYSHLPPAVQATIDLTDWRLSKLKELETEPSAVQRYVRQKRPSPLEKGRGNDELPVGRS